MANTKITSLTPYVNFPASTDIFPFVDVSDTTMAATGTTKGITAQYLMFQSGGTASLSGSFTVPIHYGSTAASGTVTIDSTSNATKGVIRLGTALIVNQASNAGTVNGSFAVTGTFTPSGQIGDSWLSPAFNTGWGNYGSGNTNVGYKKVGDLVIVRGLCRRSSGSSALITTLPIGYRPTGYQHFASVSNSAFCYLLVSSTGEITLVSGGDATVWVSLNLTFSTL